MGAGSLLNAGVSGLQATQQVLSTIGHNVANVNTEGFSRQRVDLNARPADLQGGGFVGNGVEVSNIRRQATDFLISQLRAGTGNVGNLQAFADLARQADDLLANPDAGLAPALQNFFGGVQDVADDPTSRPARQVLLNESRLMVQRFHEIEARIGDLSASVNERLEQSVTEIDGLARAIAEVNDDIRLDLGRAQGKPPNDLLDQRDELLRQLSERVSVAVTEQSDGTVNVSIGTGQNLVVGIRAFELATVDNPFEPGRGEVAQIVNGATNILSDVVSGGTLGGVVDARRRLLDPAQNILGRVAVTLATTFNEQHRLGTDLTGQLGGDYFNDLASTAPAVFPSIDNTGAPPVDLQVSVSDVTQLQASDYLLERQGAAIFLTRQSDGVVTDLGVAAPGFPAVDARIDGLTLHIDPAATLADGDRVLIRPTRFAARDIELAVLNPQSIAASAPIRAQASLANTGTGRIDAGVANGLNERVELRFTSPTSLDVIDAGSGATLAAGLAYDPAPPADAVAFNGWRVDLGGAPAAGDVFTVDHLQTSALASNAGSGTIGPASVVLQDPVTLTFGAALDTPASVPAALFNDAIGTDDNLIYSLAINGTTVYSVAEAGAPVTTLDALAAQINLSTPGTGVTALVEGGVLSLGNVPPSLAGIAVAETLSGFTPGDGDQATGYFGSALNGDTQPSITTTFTPSNPPTTFTVTGASSNLPTVTVPFTPGAPIAFNGWSVVIDGSPSIGDVFTVGSNTNGVGDNRNALRLGELQSTPFVNDGTSTYEDAYGELIVEVGVLTRQTDVNLQAQETLLERAKDARDEVSGVNLDEEAANLLRFQQAYQANAQVIATADTIFQALIDAVRR